MYVCPLSPHSCFLSADRAARSLALTGPKEQAAIGLERAIVPPHERPTEPVAGLSSEEVKWSPDGRYVIAGTPLFFQFLAVYARADLAEKQVLSTETYTSGISHHQIRNGLPIDQNQVRVVPCTRSNRSRVIRKALRGSLPSTRKMR